MPSIGKKRILGGPLERQKDYPQQVSTGGILKRNDDANTFSVALGPADRVAR
jgi:hypothetical protein